MFLITLSRPAFQRTPAGIEINIATVEPGTIYCAKCTNNNNTRLVTLAEHTSDQQMFSHFIKYITYCTSELQ